MTSALKIGKKIFIHSKAGSPIQKLYFGCELVSVNLSLSISQIQENIFPSAKYFCCKSNDLHFDLK